MKWKIYMQKSKLTTDYMIRCFNRIWTLIIKFLVINKTWNIWELRSKFWVRLTSEEKNYLQLDFDSCTYIRYGHYFICPINFTYYKASYPSFPYRLLKIGARQPSAIHYQSPLLIHTLRVKEYWDIMSNCSSRNVIVNQCCTFETFVSNYVVPLLMGLRNW